MPIFDWNGTTSTENKKAYDWDGTTSHQLGKGYDWDGTASHLIYTAETPVVENSTGLYTMEYVYRRNGAPTYSCNNNSNFEIVAGSGHYSLVVWRIPLNIKGFKSLVIKATGTATNTSGQRDYRGMFISTYDNYKATDSDSTVVLPTGANLVFADYAGANVTIDNTVDISSYTASDCYLYVVLVGYYGSTTTLNIETLTVSD